MKIIFMGSSEFSCPALEQLIASKHQVVAVFTNPPKPKGRGHKLTATPVHDLALKHSLNVYTPATLKSEEVKEQITDIDADVIVVVSYGMILPKFMLNKTKYGCINIHPSKLPKFRGAAPLQHIILSGETESAVCIIQMDAGVDTGDILMQQNVTLKADIDYPTLSQLKANLGAELLIKTLENIDNIKAYSQDLQGVSYAHKINKEDLKINWQNSSQNIDRQIRAFCDYSGAFFLHNQEMIKIFKARYNNIQHENSCGKILDDKITIKCGFGELIVEILQRSGKNKMTSQEFLRGYKLPIGTILN